MLAGEFDVVIGVDTHKHTHTAAAVSPTGAVLEHLTAPADPHGYRQLLAFGRRQGDLRLWAVEGTGTYGAGLNATLVCGGERVVEVDRPQRPARRAGAKSDDIDAVRAGSDPGAAGDSSPGCRVSHPGHLGPARPGHQRS
jgi:transposase